MSDRRDEDEVIGLLAMLPTAAGDPLREERVKERCRAQLAPAPCQRTTADRVLEGAVALISAAYLAQLARLAFLTVR